MGKILITGANGRLGRALYHHRRAFFEIGLLPLFQSRNPQDGTEWLRWDGENPHSMFENLTDLKVVLHLIGRTPQPGDIGVPNVDTEMDEINCALALRVADAAEAANVGSFMALSSAAVYGSSTPPLRESQSGSPISSYGKSKQAMEQKLKARKGPMKCISLRLGSLAGCDALLGNVMTAQPDSDIIQLDQFSSGTGPARSYIGPRDFAFTIAELAAKATANEGLPSCLNIAAEEPVTMDALLTEWNDQCRTPIEWEYCPAPDAAIETVALDTTLLSKVSPKTTRNSDASELVKQAIDFLMPMGTIP